MMNGPVSALMRRNGLQYKVNFGVETSPLGRFCQGVAAYVQFGGNFMERGHSRM